MLDLVSPNNFFNQAELNYLAGVPLIKESWDINDTVMKGIKYKIKCKLWQLQNGLCVYCMSTINPTQKEGVFSNDVDCNDTIDALPYDGDREHIAPKSVDPEYMFLPINLALSCKTCNTIKNGLPVIEQKEDEYCDCVFSIVHPYLNNINEHITFDDEVLIESQTPEGENTIKVFGLNNIFYTKMRAEKIMVRVNTTSERRMHLLRLILSYRPS